LGPCLTYVHQDLTPSSCVSLCTFYSIFVRL
jgi:hypothetical protein